MKFGRLFPGRRAVALAGLVVLTACLEPTPRTPSPQPGIIARWDPLTETVPLPTDLVRDAAVPMLKIPIHEDQNDATRELYGYLNTRDGWPKATTGSVRFGRGLGPVDPATLSMDTVNEKTVFVLDVTDPDDVVDFPVSFALTDDLLELAPTPNYWPEGRTFLIAIRGGEEGVRSADDEPLYSDLAFNFVKWEKPLTENPDPGLGETFATREENARQLEEVRLQYQPYFQLLEERGLPRADVAVLWAFTVESEREEVVYDPVLEQVPLPNDAILTAEGVVKIPENGKEDATRLKIIRGLNGMRGFSTSGAITFTTETPVQLESLTAETVRLYDVTSGVPERVVNVALRLPEWAGTEQGGRTVQLVPIDPTADHDARAPLEPGHQYVVVVTDGLTSVNGKPFGSQIFNELLKFRSPLLVDGKASLPDQMTDEEAGIVERLRSTVQPTLDALEAEGLARSAVSLVFSFKTLPIDAVTRELNELPYLADVPVDPIGVQVFTPSATLSGNGNVMTNTVSAVTGRIRTFDRLDPGTLEIRPDGAGEVREIGFAMCLPGSLVPNPNTPRPVVIVGHDMTMAKELVFAVCDTLSQRGFATIAIDLPFHGKRTVCMADAHCVAGATCDLSTHACKTAAGQPAAIRNRPSDTSTTAWSSTFPQPVAEAMQDAFLSSDLFAIRDHYAQSVIDVSALIRSIRRGNWSTGSVTFADDISYVGMGLLGGYVGATLVGAEPRLKAVAFNVAGTHLVQLLLDSPEAQGPLLARLAEQGILPDTPGFAEFEFASRWIFDPIDGMNHARRARRPIPWRDPETGAEQAAAPTKILIQAATSDTVVPASATRILGRLFGAEISTYASTATEALGGHGMWVDPTNVNRQNAIRTELGNFFQARNNP